METYQIMCFILSLTVFGVYFMFIYWRYGIQSSISTSYYAIWKRNKDDHPNRRWLFTAALWGFAFPIAVVGVEQHPLFFLAAALIMFTGAAPAFKSSKLQNTVHMVGAIGGILTAIVAFSLLGQWWLVGLIGIPIIIVSAIRVENTTWWVETIAFIGTWLGLLLLAW